MLFEDRKSKNLLINHNFKKSVRNSSTKTYPLQFWSPKGEEVPNSSTYGYLIDDPLATLH